MKVMTPAELRDRVNRLEAFERLQATIKKFNLRHASFKEQCPLAVIEIHPSTNDFKWSDDGQTWAQIAIPMETLRNWLMHEYDRQKATLKALGIVVGS